MDMKALGPDLWDVLLDMCYIVKDSVDLAGLLSNGPSNVCQCQGEILPTPKPYCPNHRHHSIAIVNSARQALGLPLLTMETPDYRLQPCSKNIMCPSKTPSATDFTHTCLSCFDFSVMVQLGMDMRVPVHSQSLQHFQNQMLHSMCSLLPCNWCRPEYAAMYRSECRPFDDAVSDPNYRFDGVHFIWHIKNMVNLKLGKAEYPEYYIEYIRQLSTCRTSIRKLWRIIIIFALLQPLPEVDYQAIDDVKSSSTLKLHDALFKHHTEKTLTSKLNLKNATMPGSEVASSSAATSSSAPRVSVTISKADAKLVTEERLTKFSGQFSPMLLGDKQATSAEVIGNYERSNNQMAAYQHFLEAITVIAKQSPTYESIVGYPYPIPVAQLSYVGSWQVKREWDWYVQFDNPDILVQRLLTDQLNGFRSDQLPMPSISAAKKLYDSYHASKALNNGVVKVSDLWLERYVEFTTNHYLHLLI